MRRTAVGRARQLAGAGLLAAVAVGAGGCWNAIPLGHRALIQILSVDAAKGGSMRWTFFQANPTALANMGSGGGSASPGGGTTSDQILPITVVAPTLALAFRKAQELTSRDLYMGQLEQIVLSEALSDRQVRSTLDGLAHTPELDQSQMLFAAPAAADRTIEAKDPQELFPAAYLDHVTACPTCNTVRFHVSLMDAFVQARTAWGSMLVPEVQTTALGLATRGLAAYEGTHFVARVPPADAALLGLITGQTGKTSMDLAVPGLGRVSVRALAARAAIKPRVGPGGAVEARVRLSLSGEVVAVEPDRGLDFGAVAPPVARAVAEAVVHRGGLVAARLMAQGADPLGIGRRLWATDPSAAPGAAMWRQRLKSARVELAARATISSEGSVR